MLMRAANLEMQANECRAAAGERLLKLRQHLPRGKTWVQYVRDRFGLSGKRADELIALNSATKPGRARRRRAPNITATAAHRQRAQRYSGQKKKAAPR
jgi:hypothetical protein